MVRQLRAGLINGRPALTDIAGKPMFTEIAVGIGDPGKKSNYHVIWAEGEWKHSGSEEQGEFYCANAKIIYRREGEGIALKSTYTNLGADLSRTEKFVGLSGIWSCGFERCVYNKFESACGTLVNEMRSIIHTRPFTDGFTAEGPENMALIDVEGNHIVAGYVSFKEMFPCMDAGSEGRLVFWQQTENHPLAGGETVEGDWVYIGLCDDIRYGQIDYAKLAGRYMDSRAGIFDTPYGYCTWYYYGSGLRPETVYENLEVFEKNKDRLDVKYFNLDNGWFKEWGDWTENEKFACGMKKIADDILAKGYLPGIWLAPYGAFKGSKIHKEHPDWFVRRWDSDAPITNPESSSMMSMDMSHPEVKAFITETFRRLTHDWGYRHVKIDIITDTLMPGRYYDPGFNSLKNYREGLRLMREAMTEDSVLLACTAPMGPSIGYADGMRTSGDIFHDWRCLKGLFNQNLKRYYMNKTWFCTDPDCLIVRNSENEDEECIRPCIRTDAENRTFATIVMATGGAMIMSDKMPLLKEYQLELLGKMFPINTQAAIPLDLAQSENVGILDLGRREKTHIWALVNWTDVCKTFEIDVGAGHTFEFWSQEYLGLKEGVAKFEVEPHGAKIVLVSDSAPITAVGVDDCLCPTILQEYKDGSLSGSFLKKGETQYIVSKSPLKADFGCAAELLCAECGLYAVKQRGEALEFCVSEKQ
ncbi:MAG: alpha-galactosidase [Clostridia bacterium]|nr:alpha-galactosidase [Clostridia bacterium]